MPRSASVGGLAKRGVIPRKQFYIKLLFFNTVILAHRTLGQIDAIGVDEIQYAKGHKYLTLVYQIDLDVTRLLLVGRERTIESFRGFFTVIGDELASKLVFGSAPICGNPT